MKYGRQSVRKYNFKPTKSVLNIESTVEIKFFSRRRRRRFSRKIEFILIFFFGKGCTFLQYIEDSYCILGRFESIQKQQF